MPRFGPATGVTGAQRAHAAEAGALEPDGQHRVVVRPAVLQALVHEGGAGRLADLDLAEVAAVHALGPVDVVAGGARHRAPAQARRPGPWAVAVTVGAVVGPPAQPLLHRGRRGAGDLVPLEGGADGRHVRRAVRRGCRCRRPRPGTACSRRWRRSRRRAGARVPVGHGWLPRKTRPRGQLQGGVLVEVEGGGRGGRGTCRSQPASADDLPSQCVSRSQGAAAAGQARRLRRGTVRS